MAPDALRELPLADIHDNPSQPRIAMNPEVVAGVRAAIENAGGSYPAAMALVVRPRAAGGWEIIAGHHRATAAREMAIDLVWAHVQDLDDRAAALALATSNNQACMTPLEHGRHAMRLNEDFGVPFAEYARSVGMTSTAVYRQVNAYRVLMEYGGVEGQYAAIPVAALSELFHVKDAKTRAALLFQFWRRKTTGPKAEQVVALVKEGKPMREAFDVAEGRLRQGGRLGAGVGGATLEEIAASRLSSEMLLAYENALALALARCEALEARFTVPETDVDTFNEAIAQRHRELAAVMAVERGKGRTPKIIQASSVSPKPLACVDCFHARVSAFVPGGFKCSVGREDECMPLTQGRCFVAKAEEDGPDVA